MNFAHRWLVLVLFGVLMALGGAACVSNDPPGLPPACAALNACCSLPTFDPSETVSCQETAQSGQETDAGCGEQLATYQQQGQCPLDGG